MGIPNEKSKSRNITEKNNWLPVASEEKEKFPNLLIKGRKCNNFCIEHPRLCPMTRENWQLVTDEPVEVQDCRKITNHSRGIHRIYLNLIKEIVEDVHM